MNSERTLGRGGGGGVWGGGGGGGGGGMAGGRDFGTVRAACRGSCVTVRAACRGSCVTVRAARRKIWLWGDGSNACALDGGGDGWCGGGGGACGGACVISGYSGMSAWDSDGDINVGFRA